MRDGRARDRLARGIRLLFCFENLSQVSDDLSGWGARAPSPRCRPARRSRRSTSDRRPRRGRRDASVRRDPCRVRPQHRPARRLGVRTGKRGCRRAGAQRRRQEHSAARGDRAAETAHGHDPARRRGRHRAGPAPAGGPGDGLRTPGPAMLPASDHGGEPATGRRRPPRRQGRDRRGPGPLSGAGRAGGPPGRAALRRAAPAVGHRPGAAHQAQAAAARRAHRGHPAHGGRRDRTDHPVTGRPDVDPAGGTARGLRVDGRAAVLRAGGRPGAGGAGAEAAVRQALTV